MGKEFHSFLARASGSSPTAKRILIVLGVFVVLMGVYVGGYYCCVEVHTYAAHNGSVQLDINRYSLGEQVYVFESPLPRYRIYEREYAFLDTLFKLIHFVDRHLRRDTWMNHEEFSFAGEMYEPADELYVSREFKGMIRNNLAHGHAVLTMRLPGGGRESRGEFHEGEKIGIWEIYFAGAKDSSYKLPPLGKEYYIHGKQVTKSEWDAYEAKQKEQ